MIVRILRLDGARQPHFAECGGDLPSLAPNLQLPDGFACDGMKPHLDTELDYLMDTLLIVIILIMCGFLNKRLFTWER